MLLSGLLNPSPRGDLHVTKSNHANSLPNAEANAGGHTPVETLDAVLTVDVAESVADSHLLRPVGVLLLALHLDTNDLDGLVPGTETTSDGRGQDLLPGVKLLLVTLASEVADTALSKTAEAEARAPVGHLADGNSVDTLVDATDTLTTVDVHEGSKGRLRLDTRSSLLVFGDLDSLHACAEAHGGVGLSHTTSDTADDTTSELVGSSSASVILGLGRNKEENSTLGRGLNPGPRDKSLVETQDAATGPDTAEGGAEPVTAVGGHRGLDDLEGLAEGGDLEHVEAGAEQQVGELDWLLLQLLGLPNGGG